MSEDLFKYATKYTRDVLAGKPNPSINPWNGKPYRTKAQKIEARRLARRGEDGAYYSSAPVSWHPAPRGSAQ